MDRSAVLEVGHKPLDVAILGAGNMGSKIVRALQRIPNVRIRYVYSRTFSNAEKLAFACDAVPLDQSDRVYDESQVSVVFDCLPTFTRLSTLAKMRGHTKARFLREASRAEQSRWQMGYATVSQGISKSLQLGKSFGSFGNTDTETNGDGRRCWPGGNYSSFSLCGIPGGWILVCATRKKRRSHSGSISS